MNKKQKIKKWVKEHDTELLITVSTFGTYLVGLGIGYYIGGERLRCSKKQIESLGEYTFISETNRYTIGDLGKVGLESMSMMPDEMKMINENSKVNKILYFIDKP